MTAQRNTAKTGALVAAALAALLLATPAAAQTGTSSGGPTNATPTRDGDTLSHDCTEVSVEYADEPGLTREERIARMDRAFERSLSRFEECQSQRAGNASGGEPGVGMGGGTGGELRGTGNAGPDGTESDGAETSTAASDISGPEAATDAPVGNLPSTPAHDVSGDPPSVTASTTPNARPNVRTDGAWTRPDDEAAAGTGGDEIRGDPSGTTEPVREAARTRTNGKVPEDIPPADNDSALEAQIRQAAIEETDPALKKRLWDEYRRYKGLPVPE